MAQRQGETIRTSSHLLLLRSPHHLRRYARATAGSEEKMDTGMARSLVGRFSGRLAMTYLQLSPLSLMRSSPRNSPRRRAQVMGQLLRPAV